ncbi:MAG: hypothetical protein MHM6MM_003703 [Cercozoa sp. M6MM]
MLSIAERVHFISDDQFFGPRTGTPLNMADMLPRTQRGYFTPKMIVSRQSHLIFQQCARHAMHPRFVASIGISPCTDTDIFVISVHLWLATLAMNRFEKEVNLSEESKDDSVDVQMHATAMFNLRQEIMNRAQYDFQRRCAIDPEYDHLSQLKRMRVTLDLASLVQRSFDMAWKDVKSGHDPDAFAKLTMMLQFNHCADHTHMAKLRAFGDYVERQARKCEALSLCDMASGRIPFDEPPSPADVMDMMPSNAKYLRQCGSTPLSAGVDADAHKYTVSAMQPLHMEGVETGAPGVTSHPYGDDEALVRLGEELAVAEERYFDQLARVMWRSSAHDFVPSHVALEPIEHAGTVLPVDRAYAEAKAKEDTGEWIPERVRDLWESGQVQRNACLAPPRTELEALAVGRLDTKRAWMPHPDSDEGRILDGLLFPNGIHAPPIDETKDMRTRIAVRRHSRSIPDMFTESEISAAIERLKQEIAGSE